MNFSGFSLCLWSPLHVRPPSCGARSFDAAVNVFWDPIGSAERRITKKYDFAIYAYHPWNPIFWRNADQRVITLSALAASLCALLLRFHLCFFFIMFFFIFCRVSSLPRILTRTGIINPSLLCLFKKAIFRDGGNYYKLDKYFVMRLLRYICYWNCVSLQRRLSLLLPFH